MNISKVDLYIGAQLRKVREKNLLSQNEAALSLGISQSRLSKIERGQAKLYADELVRLVQQLNIPLELFFKELQGAEHDRLQNALAALGAKDLAESQDVLPSSRLLNATRLLSEILISAPDTRQVAGLAPVVVANIRNLNLAVVWNEFRARGLERRLGWLLDNVREATVRELSENHEITLALRNTYRSASTILEDFLNFHKPHVENQPEDIVEVNPYSAAALEAAKSERSETSRRWGVLSRLRPEDFQEALRRQSATHS